MPCCTFCPASDALYYGISQLYELAASLITRIPRSKKLNTDDVRVHVVSDANGHGCTEEDGSEQDVPGDVLCNEANKKQHSGDIALTDVAVGRD